MAEQVFYFTLDYAVEVHDWLIEQSGGLAGVNNLGLLDSALEHIQNDLFYPCFEDKLTHLVFSVIQLHAFSDGNKRSSLALGSYFLELNGYDFLVRRFVLEMENIVVWVAEGTISKDLLRDLIESLIYEEDYNESLKLRLAIAVMKEEQDL